MSTITPLACSLLLALMLLGGQHPLPPVTIPAPPAPEQTHPVLPIDEPPVVVRGARRRPPNVQEMKKQAEELANLAASIPNEVDSASKGKLSKDLPRQLKQIDKLSKQLRRELSR